MSFLWSSAPPSPPKPMPIVYLYSCHNLHIRLAGELLDIMESVMKKPKHAFIVNLFTITDEKSDEFLVSIKSVMKLAVIMKNISSHVAVQAETECIDMSLSYEIGKLASKLSSEDKLIILSDSKNVADAFKDFAIFNGVQAKIYSGNYLNDINSIHQKR